MVLGAVVWIYGWNGADKAPVLGLLLGSACTPRRLGGRGMSCGGDAAGIADPSWPKEYSLLWTMLSNETDGGK